MKLNMDKIEVGDPVVEVGDNNEEISELKSEIEVFRVDSTSPK